MLATTGTIIRCGCLFAGALCGILPSVGGEVRWESTAKGITLSPSTSDQVVRFQFTAISSPERILEVQGDCSCLSITPSGRLFKQGEQGEIVVSVSNKGVSARKEHTILVQFANIKSPQRLTLTVENKSPITCETRLLAWEKPNEVKEVTVTVDAPFALKGRLDWTAEQSFRLFVSDPEIAESTGQKKYRVLLWQYQPRDQETGILWLDLVGAKVPYADRLVLRGTSRALR